MNIGIIVYSQTGNTLKAAESIKDTLKAKGHKAAIEQVTIEGELAPDKPVKLTSTPDASKYDALIVASPVMAFSLNPVMKAYLSQIKEISGKKTACFVAQGLPFNWMGGNQALKWMSRQLRSKGADICGTGTVHVNEKQAAAAVAKLGGLF